MTFFSDANLEAVRIRPKIRLCDKCGSTMEFHSGQGFCCPKGHGCEWPKEELAPPNYYACQGSTYKKGSSGKGRKRKKKPKRGKFSHLYTE